MKKIFVLAALALTLAACSKQEIQPVGQNDGMITLKGTLAPKGAATKGLTDDGSGGLRADWAVGEKLAIFYRQQDGFGQVCAATVTEVKANGSASITFSVQQGTPDNTSCTIVYPASVVDIDDPEFLDYWEDYLENENRLIVNQGGRLDSGLDVRLGTGVINPVTPSAGLVLDAPLEPNFAIVKFTLKSADNAPISARSLAVVIDKDAYVATPASATDVFYIALPAVSGKKMLFSAIEPGYSCSKPSVTVEAGKYYRSTLTMAALGTDPDYIEMGDGLKWATRNIGATSPEDYGDYFAWGEINSLKSNYSWDTYVWCDGTSRTLTKYCFNAFYGKNSYIDAYSELNAEDDVAAKRLGLDWRLPTLDEWQKLGNTSDFTWVWVENYNNTNKNGSLVISKIAGYEGRTIFLPASGHKIGGAIENMGLAGYSWSSSFKSSSFNNPDPSKAFSVYYCTGSSTYVSAVFRAYGLTVRPVRSGSPMYDGLGGEENL